MIYKKDAAGLLQSLLGLSHGPWRWSAGVQASALSRKQHNFCCDQNRPPARREGGAYLDRYVTDEQRSRWPIFITTLRAVALWLFFCVALSLRIDSDMLVVPDGTTGTFHSPTAQHGLREGLVAARNIEAAIREIEQVITLRDAEALTSAVARIRARAAEYLPLNRETI